MHPAYPDFLNWTRKTWGCDKFVCLGDMVDHSAMSYHAKELDLDNADKEIDKAREQLAPIFKIFKTGDLILGNHDALPNRKAQDAMISQRFLKTFHDSDTYAVPTTWRIHPRYSDLVIDNVIYRHGDKGKGGQYLAAYRNAKEEFKSVVQGHFHTQFGVQYYVNGHHRLFGVQAGTGVEPDSPYMRYNKVYSARPVLGCFVIFDGVEAMPVPMRLEEW